MTEGSDRAVYLAAHRAVEGIRPLLQQHADVEGFVAIHWRSACVRLFVDSGRPDGAPDWGPALERLLAEVRAGTIRDVAVARLSVLAPTRGGARRAQRALEAAGAVIHCVRTARRVAAIAATREMAL